jgi:hypothetical protein
MPLLKMKYRDKNWLQREYVDLKKSMRTIAIECGRGETAIHKWLHRFDIPIRSRTEAMRGLKKSEEHKKKLSDWAKTRTGDKNPCWRGGRVKEKARIRHCGWRERRKLTLERDNHECQDCGIDLNLHVHHIKPVKDYPELINSIDNCITLCADCHRRLHFSKENSANSGKPRTGNPEPSSQLSGNPDLGFGGWVACVETLHGVA